MMRMMMKMAAAGILLLLCCSVIATAAQKERCDVNAAEGEDVVIPLGHKLKNTDRLTWKKGETTLVYKRGDNFITGTEDKISPDGSLKLRKVKKTDEGEYIVHVHNEAGVKLSKDNPRILCVLDNVPKPTVEFQCKDGKVTFSCKVKKTPDLKFAWMKNKATIANKQSQNLQLVVKDTTTDDLFQCSASNAAMVQTSEPVKHNCEVSIFPAELFGFDFWIMVAILAGGGGLVLLLIIIVIVCCIKARRKKSMKIKEEEELRLGWTNPEQEHHHHHHHHPEDNSSTRYLHPTHQHQQHHHQQQQPAGHTGPRQPRTKQQRELRPRAPPTPGSGSGGGGQPQPSPRRAAAQIPRSTADDEEQPPPLPQPRKKGPRTQRV